MYDRRPFLVLLGIACAACFLPSELAYADETCNSPYISNLIRGQEATAQTSS